MCDRVLPRVPRSRWVPQLSPLQLAPYGTLVLVTRKPPSSRLQRTSAPSHTSPTVGFMARTNVGLAMVVNTKRTYHMSSCISVPCLFGPHCLCVFSIRCRSQGCECGWCVRVGTTTTPCPRCVLPTVVLTCNWCSSLFTQAIGTQPQARGRKTRERGREQWKCLLSAWSYSTVRVLVVP